MTIHSEDIPRIRGEAATRRQDSRDRDHAGTLWEKSPLKKRLGNIFYICLWWFHIVVTHSPTSLNTLSKHGF